MVLVVGCADLSLDGCFLLHSERVCAKSKGPQSLVLNFGVGDQDARDAGPKLEARLGVGSGRSRRSPQISKPRLHGPEGQLSIPCQVCLKWWQHEAAAKHVTLTFTRQERASHLRVARVPGNVHASRSRRYISMRVTRAMTTRSDQRPTSANEVHQVQDERRGHKVTPSRRRILPSAVQALPLVHLVLGRRSHLEPPATVPGLRTSGSATVQATDRMTTS